MYLFFIIIIFIKCKITLNFFRLLNMIKKTHILFFTLFVFAQILSAQQKNKTFVLKWNDTSQITIKNQTTTLPLLTSGTFDEFKLPIYNQQWNVAQNLKIDTYQIKNVRFENLDKNRYPLSSHTHFPTKINSSLKIKKARDSAFAIFNISLLVYKNGQLKKIVAFDLSYSLSPKSNLKNNTTIHDSPLATGKWFQFAIDKTGIYKISKSFLNSLGVNTNSINPKNIQIYGNGGAMLNEKNGDFRYDGLQENAIYIQGENDASFDNNDFILFYAQGADTWKHDLSSRKATHQKNIYSNKATYFIHIGANLGKRISNQTVITNAATTTITSSNDFMVHEEELHNLDHFGQEFFSESFHIDNEQTFTFNFTDLDITKNIDVKLKVASSATNNINFTLDLNTQNIMSLSVAGIGNSQTEIGKTISQTTNTTVNNELLEFVVKFDNLGKPSAHGFLDYIEINGIKNLIARDKQFSFRNYDFANTLNTDIGEYQIQNNTNIYQIWNITDKINPTTIANQATDANFSFKAYGGFLQEYIILNKTDFYTPQRLATSTVQNQNLHALQDVDYLIITKPELLDQANRLANYHQVNSNLSTLVLTEQIIYNEFSSGSKDATAIRDFIHHLYTMLQLQITELNMY